MGETLRYPSEPPLVTGDFIPVIKEKTNVGSISWAPAFALEGHGEAFDWIVTNLYQRVKAALAPGGHVGVAEDFRARVGVEVKLRSINPYRRGHYSVLEFLILKTPTGVSVSLGRGTYRAFPYRFEEFGVMLASFAALGCVAALLSYWTHVLLVWERASANFWMKPGGAVLVTSIAAPLGWAMAYVWRDKPDEPALRSSADETVESVFHQFVQVLKTPGTSTLSE